MTQEERTLLHMDLSERVPYDTVLKVKGLVTSNEEFGDAYLDTVSWYEEVSVRDGSRVSYDIADVRPYLRPLSSMTDEEREELKKLMNCDYVTYSSLRYTLGGQVDYDDFLVYYEESGKLTDWLNKKMFDYRGLIPKGLALKAPEGMYKND